MIMMMNKFKWGNAADPSVYLDENNKRMFSNFRRLFGNLSEGLLAAGDTTKAVLAAKRGLDLVPADKMPYDFFALGPATTLIKAGKRDEGLKIIHEIMDYSKGYLDYAVDLSPENRFGLEYPVGINMQSLLDIYNMALDLKMETLLAEIEPVVSTYYSILYSPK